MTRPAKKKPRPLAKPARTYAKVALGAQETLDRLWQRGLLVDDRAANIRALRAIGYFRLLIYMRRVQNPKTGQFRPRTRFSGIVALYDFDRRLRSVTMDAIERIEVALRAALSNPLAIIYGPHWYVNPVHFDGLREYARVLDQIAKGCEAKKGIALIHYHETYGKPDLPPVWLVCEHLTLGALSRVFKALVRHQRKLAGRYLWPDIPDEILCGWFQTLTDLRNACAHHARLWNMKMTVSPPGRPKPGGPLGRYAPGMSQPDTFYARATMMKALLDPLGHGVQWQNTLRQTIDSCRHVDPVAHLGFPADWQTTPPWD